MPPKPRDYGITERKLREMYQDNKMSQNEIAEHFNVTRQVIRDRMNKYEIETRREGRSEKIKIDKNILKTLYKEEKMTQSEIAEKYGVSKGVIRHRMRKYSIERRSYRYYMKGERNRMWGGGGM